jgi:transcriptional regulator
VLALTGDYAYVEAAWNANPGTDPAYGVPTSYYTGNPAALPRGDHRRPGAEGRHPGQQLRHFEPADSGRSRPPPTTSPTAASSPASAACACTIESVRAKMKYGGNKEPDHRREIADHLAERDGPMDSRAGSPAPATGELVDRFPR